MKLKSVVLCAIVFPVIVSAQYAASVSGSTTAAAEINGKPNWQTSTSSCVGLNGPVGKDFCTDTVTGFLYTPSVTGIPATWVRKSGGPQHYTFRGLNQNTVGGFNLSAPEANAPTAVSIEGASSGDITSVGSAWNYSTLSFAANASAATGQSGEGSIYIPITWTASDGFKANVTWRTSATTGNVLWQIQGQCVATTGIPGNFSVPTAFAASTANGTTLHFTQTSELSLTTSNVLAGCAAGNVFLFRFFRDHQNGSDTLTSAAELVILDFSVIQ